ncbi:MAG: hypothetical protein ACOVQL_09160, partial [Limnohabitans sp.]
MQLDQIPADQRVALADLISRAGGQVLGVRPAAPANAAAGNFAPLNLPFLGLPGFANAGMPPPPAQPTADNQAAISALMAQMQQGFNTVNNALRVTVAQNASRRINLIPPEGVLAGGTYAVQFSAIQGLRACEEAKSIPAVREVLKAFGVVEEFVLDIATDEMKSKWATKPAAGLRRLEEMMRRRDVKWNDSLWSDLKMVLHSRKDKSSSSESSTESSDSSDDDKHRSSSSSSSSSSSRRSRSPRSSRRRHKKRGKKNRGSGGGRDKKSDDKKTVTTALSNALGASTPRRLPSAMDLSSDRTSYADSFLAPPSGQEVSGSGPPAPRPASSVSPAFPFPADAKADAVIRFVFPFHFSEGDIKSSRLDNKIDCAGLRPAAPFKLAELNKLRNKKVFDCSLLTCSVCGKLGHLASFCVLPPNWEATPALMKGVEGYPSFVDRLRQPSVSSDIHAWVSKVLSSLPANSSPSAKIGAVMKGVDALASEFNVGNPWKGHSLKRDKLRASVGMWKAIGSPEFVLSWIMNGKP